MSDEGVRRNPDHPYAWKFRARVWRRKGEFDQALADHTRAFAFPATDPA